MGEYGALDRSSTRRSQSIGFMVTATRWLRKDGKWPKQTELKGVLFLSMVPGITIKSSIGVLVKPRGSLTRRSRSWCYGRGFTEAFSRLSWS